MTNNSLIPHLFKTEYSKLIAVLCKTFGLKNIELAEDIVSETFLLAAETWGKKGVPENQVAWLYTVAKNKTRDQLRRKNLYTQKIEVDLKYSAETSSEMEVDLSSQNILDSQLQMLFAVCHPIIPIESQIGLALRILCGFGIDEIAIAFLSNKETTNKRLYRAKEKLRKEQIAIEFPSEEELPSRLESVLRTLYLLFNEGYYSNAPQKTLRKDLCYDAIHLTYLLTQHTSTNKPEVNALLSLMCFHASRFEARLDANGEFVLYEAQNTDLWDKGLIEKGAFYLTKASKEKRLTKYHLEAAIAFWHTEKEDTAEKWDHILQLYNLLLQVEYSPMTALNRTYALAKVQGMEAGIAEALKINLAKSHLYHCLLAELYKEQNVSSAKKHLELALQLAPSKQDKLLIQQKIESFS